MVLKVGDYIARAKWYGPGGVMKFPAQNADRSVFGTDYPFGAEAGEDFYRENLKWVKAMNLPAAEMEKVLSGNAKKLPKIA